MKIEIYGDFSGQVAEGDVHNHGPVIIQAAVAGKPKIKVVVPTGPEHISDDQAVALQKLVQTVVQTEQRLKQQPATQRNVWGALNAHCRVPSYRLIRADDFSRAEKYLRQWVGRLGSMASAPVKDGDAWRKRHYAYIKINSKDAPEAVTRYIAKNFQASSIAELDNAQLEQVYRYVASRKNKRR